MDQALHGAALGLAIGVFLMLSEYVLVSRSVSYRAKKLGRKPEFDQNDRKRIAGMLRFVLVLPFAFAAVFWWVWG